MTAHGALVGSQAFNLQPLPAVVLLPGFARRPRIESRRSRGSTAVPAASAASRSSRLPARSPASPSCCPSGSIEHARDAMWQIDGLIDTYGAAVNATTNASRLARGPRDLRRPRVRDRRARAPRYPCQRADAASQKPVRAAVIRGAAGLLLGKLAGVVAMQQTPRRATDNLLYTYREVVGAVHAAADVVELAATVIDSLTVDEQRLRELAQTGFAQATDVTKLSSSGRTSTTDPPTESSRGRRRSSRCGDLTHAALRGGFSADPRTAVRDLGERSSSASARQPPRGSTRWCSIAARAWATRPGQLDSSGAPLRQMPSALNDAVAIAAR